MPSAERGSIALTMMRLFTISEPRDMRGLGESCRHFLPVAVAEVHRHVAGNVRVNLRRVWLDRCFRHHKRRKLVDLDHHRVGGIASKFRAFRHDERHRLPDMAHLVGGDGMPSRPKHRRAVAVLDRDAGRIRLIAGGGEIGAGEDREHARHGERLARVDRADRAVRMRAPHHRHVGLALDIDVVGVAPLATDERQVFFAPWSLTDTELEEMYVVLAGFTHYPARLDSAVSLRAARIASTTASPISTVPTRLLPGSKISAVR